MSDDTPDQQEPDEDPALVRAKIRERLRRRVASTLTPAERLLLEGAEAPENLRGAPGYVLPPLHFPSQWTPQDPPDELGALRRKEVRQPSGALDQEGTARKLASFLGVGDATAILAEIERQAALMATVEVVPTAVTLSEAAYAALMRVSPGVERLTQVALGSGAMIEVIQADPSFEEELARYHGVMVSGEGPADAALVPN